MPGDNIFLSSKNGRVIKGTVLRASSVARSDVAGQSKELNLLFDAYSKHNAGGGQNQIDGYALNFLYHDLSKAAGEDSILTTEEITKYLKDKNLNGKISTKAVQEFISNISDATIVDGIRKALDGLGTSSSLSDYLKSIPPAKMAKVMKMYKSEYNISMVQDICNEIGSFGSTRESYLNIIRDKIAATKPANEAKEFKAKFDAEIKSMDITLFGSADAKKLEQIILDSTSVQSAPKSIYPKPAKRSAEYLEKENRRLIAQMMNDPKLCRTTDDRKRIVDRIMKYAKLNNPTDLIKEYTKSSDERVRQAAQHLLDSTFLDYFPIFVASIIAQESQFRETDDNPKTGVFIGNGKGVMQITSAVPDEIASKPGHFSSDFIKRLSKYCDVKDTTSIVQAYSKITRQSVIANYDIGTAYLRNSLRIYFNRIKDSNKDSPYYKEYMNMKSDLENPATIMQFMAMIYNGNSDPKTDEAHNKSKSQVRYVYARDVIERFKKYTPSDVPVSNYFDYNPKTKKFEIVTK